MKPLGVLPLGLTLLTGCSDATLRLIGESGVPVMTYRCSAPELQAQTPEEHKLIRQTAGRILRYEREQHRTERVSAFQLAFQADDAALEAAMLEYACAYGLPPERPARFPERGSIARDFSLPLLVDQADGATEGDKPIQLSDHKGQVVVLNFWASWCKPCWDEHARLNSFVQENRDDRILVYGVLHRDSPQRALDWLKANGGMVFPTLLDTRSEVSQLYQVRGIPRTFIISPEGRIVESHFGIVDVRALKEAVSALLPRH